MEWSTEKCIHLINDFEKHQCLWNVQVKEYKNVLKKKDAWHDIGINLESTAEDVEKKMKSLLAAYRREKKKIIDSTKSGSGTDDIYIPKWYAYKHMKFLSDINRPKKTRESSDKIEKSYEHVEEDELEENNGIEIEEDDTTESVDLEIRSDVTSEATPTNNCKKRPRKGKKLVTENKEDIAFRNMQSVMRERELRHTRDEYSAYGEVVGHKIRKLSTEYEREITQFKINEILLHASLGYFRKSPGGSQISLLPSTQTSACSPLGPPLPHETRVPSTASFSRPSSSQTFSSPLTSPNTLSGENSRSESWDNENSSASCPHPDTRNFYQDFGTNLVFRAL